jgi:3-oxoadipate enol-lactonase
MQFADINGHTIHYKYIENPSFKAGHHVLVFINSLGTDFRIWNDVVELLKDNGNILLFDNRGHGLSDVVENTKGLPDFVEDTSVLLEYLSVKKCVPVGLSVGGMVAQVLSGVIPEKIEKLVLCDTRHKIGNAQIWNDRIASVKEKGISSISDGVMQRWFSDKFRSDESIKVSGYKNMLERIPALGYIKTCEAIRDADLTEIASAIKIPSLCIVGSEDKSTSPVEVRNLADLISGSRFEVIEGSGHIPCVDNPKILSNLIIDFLK